MIGDGFHALAEEVAFALLHQMLADLGVGAVQTVLIDHHRLQLLPVFPSFFADFSPDALAEFARNRRKIEPFGVFVEFDAVHGACHGRYSLKLLDKNL